MVSVIFILQFTFTAILLLFNTSCLNSLLNLILPFNSSKYFVLICLISWVKEFIFQYCEKLLEKCLCSVAFFLSHCCFNQCQHSFQLFILTRCTLSRALARAATRRLAILNKVHAFACFGSRGYSPARYIHGRITSKTN